jgi:hypothetical protein
LPGSAFVVDGATEVSVWVLVAGALDVAAGVLDMSGLTEVFVGVAVEQEVIRRMSTNINPNKVNKFLVFISPP